MSETGDSQKPQYLCPQPPNIRPIDNLNERKQTPLPAIDNMNSPFPQFLIQLKKVLPPLISRALTKRSNPLPPENKEQE